MHLLEFLALPRALLVVVKFVVGVWEEDEEEKVNFYCLVPSVGV